MSRKRKAAHKENKETRAPRLSLVNLGCAKNTVDSEIILGGLLSAGWELSPDLAYADLVIINTCAFIEPARAESYSVIEEILSGKDKSGMPLVVVSGCLSEREGESLMEKFPALDGVFGIGSYNMIEELCARVLGGEKIVALPQPENAEKHTDTFGRKGRGGKCHEIADGPRLLLTDASYAYLRISEGCDNICSYCAIPNIRGPLRSRPIRDIVEEAAGLIEGGARELVLVSQDTANYGRDLQGRSMLADLLKELLEKTDDCWIRVLYAHPAHLESEVIRLIGSEPRLCNYLDIPIQHINDKILTRMNRHCKRADIERLLDEIRQTAPEMVLRTSLITGFPGESDKEFDELLEFVRRGYFNHLGTFAYSKEAGTPAADFDEQCNDKTSEGRMDLLMQVQQEVTFKWMDSRLGKNVTLVADCEVEDGLWCCRSKSEAPEVDGSIYTRSKKLYAGAIFTACLTERDGYDIWAKELRSR